MTFDPLFPAYRPQFFPGQLLTAEDLSAGQDVDTGLRRLHHRMLHGWGIASGLTVTGWRGGTEVALGAGYALDAEGRELVVDDPLTVPVPPVASGPAGDPVPFALVVRWTEDEEAVVVDRAGACGTRGAVRRSDVPTVGWLDGPVREGLDVVLAEVAVHGCRLSQPPDPAARRLLNPPPTPYAASGATWPGYTPWQARQDDAGRVWAVETEVDTAEAGFGDVPVYLVNLGGDRLLSAAASPTGASCVLDGVPHVEAPEAGRFRVLVPLPAGVSVAGTAAVDVNPPAVVGHGDLLDVVATTLAWSVQWIGVQR
ncbi:hypothetical protein [Ornithinimicrobium pekingense]|nr:hypothetical protein [Ornithinimicrobium pekingense]